MTDDYTEPLLAHEVLARARKDMAQYGKGRGSLFDIGFPDPRGVVSLDLWDEMIAGLCKEAPRCLLGAIKGARGEYNICSFPEDDDPAVAALADAIIESGTQRGSDNIHTVYGWNDGILPDSRSIPTKEEAVAMLEKAEALAFTRLVEGS